MIVNVIFVVLFVILFIYKIQIVQHYFGLLQAAKSDKNLHGGELIYEEIQEEPFSKLLYFINSSNCNFNRF